ncbi:TPA: hypothetical protein N0F65_006538 [Lagenidium giganteum]|uniref:Uncharacterized protein n=1 Tax=Lagenidium giganteum TaxID=4803 RepID=A0AAV2YHT1_9STRA|nr:TPA: hypothetical protein N0F65_006538 [Lagenidium giganteum]
MTGEHDEAPVKPVRRIATDLHPEEIQAEFTRYNIPGGDVSSRLHALQLKYDDEYEAGSIEYEAYQRKVELKKTREDYRQAVCKTKELEQASLEANPKIHAIVRQIEQDVAPKHLVLRGLPPLCCCAMMRAMRTNMNVVTLDISNNGLDDTAIESIGKMLAKNRKLSTLNLGFNNFTSRLLPVIASGLRQNAVLTSLNLESNPLMSLAKDYLGTLSRSGQANAAIVEPFASVLAQNDTLTSLNLFNTQINAEVGRVLVHALDRNLTLLSLEVGGNAIAQPDLALMAIRLERNQAKMLEVRVKATELRQTIHTHAEEIHSEQLKAEKEKEDKEWHDANARQRHEIREKEEWERARLEAEQAVRRASDIENWNKKYREQREAEKKKAKGKK